SRGPVGLRCPSFYLALIRLDFKNKLAALKRHSSLSGGLAPLQVSAAAGAPAHRTCSRGALDHFLRPDRMVDMDQFRLALRPGTCRVVWTFSLSSYLGSTGLSGHKRCQSATPNNDSKCRPRLLFTYLAGCNWGVLQC